MKHPLTAVKAPTERKGRSAYRIDPAALRKFQTLCDIYTNSLVHKRSVICASEKKNSSANNTSGRCSSARPLRKQCPKLPNVMSAQSATSLTNAPKMTGIGHFNEGVKLTVRSPTCNVVKLGSARTSASGKTQCEGKTSKEKTTHKKSSVTPPPPIVKRVSTAGNKVHGHRLDHTSKKGRSCNNLRFPPLSSVVWKQGVVFSHGSSEGKPSRRSEKKRKTFPFAGRSNFDSMIPSDDALSNCKLESIGTNERTAKSQSCEFEKRAGSTSPRLCMTPQPPVTKFKQRSEKANAKRVAGNMVDNRKSLNQFHEKRRAQFKTMFPFQNTHLLGCKMDESMKCYSRGEETPSETSLYEDGGTMHTITANVTRTDTRGEGVGVSNGCKGFLKEKVGGKTGWREDEKQLDESPEIHDRGCRQRRISNKRN